MTFPAGRGCLLHCWWAAVPVVRHLSEHLCFSRMHPVVGIFQDAVQRCRISPQISLWGQGQWLLLEKGNHWYRHPWSRPFPLLSPPVSVYARGRRTPSFERRNPPGAACRVIFPGDILLKLCNTWLFFASSHSAPLVSPGALALIYLTGNALSECPISNESHLCNFSRILELCSCKHVTDLTPEGQRGSANVL